MRFTRGVEACCVRSPRASSRSRLADITTLGGARPGPRATVRIVDPRSWNALPGVPEAPRPTWTGGGGRTTVAVIRVMAQNAGAFDGLENGAPGDARLKFPSAVTTIAPVVGATSRPTTTSAIISVTFDASLTYSSAVRSTRHDLEAAQTASTISAEARPASGPSPRDRDRDAATTRGCWSRRRRSREQ
jgi:hypothetical protein